MTTPKTWMVRAGRGGVYFENFRDRSIVAIGWAALGDLSRLDSREAFVAAVRETYPTKRQGALAVEGGQLYRFVKEFSEGDRVVTYDSRARVYLRGEIKGPYTYCPGEDNEGLRNRRNVSWGDEVPRDLLSEAAKNSLGSMTTIFAVAPNVSAELWGEAGSQPDVSETETSYGEASGLAITVQTEDDVLEAATNVIQDRIAELSWQELQELVAGVLRAIGYATSVSPPGADRGKDIIASPDGLGLQDPRIVVEVKHRRETRMGAQEIRSFVGGRHPHDRGLYVSTGGFSKDAHYEAERANIPLTLMDLKSLVEAILEHYPKFDEQTKQLLPLTRVYWPVSK